MCTHTNQRNYELYHNIDSVNKNGNHLLSVVHQKALKISRPGTLMPSSQTACQYRMHTHITAGVVIKHVTRAHTARHYRYMYSGYMQSTTTHLPLSLKKTKKHMHTFFLNNKPGNRSISHLTICTEHNNRKTSREDHE